MAVQETGEASPLDVAVMEANALALGLSIDALMENAARAVAEEAAAHLPPAGRVAILAGTGNNGGDGTGAAFYLGQWGFRPEIWLVRDPSEIRGASARRCWERARSRFPTQLGVPPVEALRGADLVLDALLGSGQAGELRSPYRESVDAANRSESPILAVDVPTGAGHAGAIRARWTVALTVRKSGTPPAASGEVAVRDIGIPREAWEQTGPGEFLRFPAGRRGDATRQGRVLVIGGGPFSGAPALAALAALRSGAERATVAAPSPAAEAIRALSPDLIVRTIGDGAFHPSHVPALRELLEAAPADAIVLGMGVGRSADTLEAMRALIDGWRGHRPMLVDADALGALDRRPGGAASLVATPNEVEYRHVFGPDDSTDPVQRLATARRRAEEWGVTLLAKGPWDLLSDGRGFALNRHHEPAATVGGVGDVLAGVVGGLMAQGLATLDAARLGAFWVGDAGRRAAEARGRSLLASDVLDALSASLVEGRRRVAV